MRPAQKIKEFFWSVDLPALVLELLQLLQYVAGDASRAP